MRNSIYAFVFQGILASVALEEQGARKRVISHKLVEEIAQMLSLNILDPALVAKASEMATVYTAIAAFENSSRRFISKVMLENAGADWWNLCVSKKIRDKSKTREREELKVKWHTQRGNDPINYTDLDDLYAIIATNWSFFEHNIGEQAWVNQIFSTIEKSRNVIMHSGELSREDISRIGSLIRDWVKQVGV